MIANPNAMRCYFGWLKKTQELLVNVIFSSVRRERVSRSSLVPEKAAAWKSVENSVPSLINYANGPPGTMLKLFVRDLSGGSSTAAALIIHRIITIITITVSRHRSPSASKGQGISAREYNGALYLTKCRIICIFHDANYFRAISRHAGTNVPLIAPVVSWITSMVKAIYLFT